MAPACTPGVACLVVRDSLDLLLDDAGEAAVRAEWRRLSEAGVPSSGDRVDASHAPHLTLAERDRVEPAAEAALAGLVALLPLTLHLGPPVVLGGPGRRVLARSVAPTPGLVELHAEAARILGGGGPPWSAPGRWLPHVTLSRRSDDASVVRALPLLGEAYDVRATRLQRWEPAARRLRQL